jgi:hypothetical protein
VPALLIRHKVNDFDTWMSVFLEDAEVRRANGSQNEFHYRNSADPNEIWILLEWDDLFRASLFVKSDDMIDALTRAGVIDNPDYWYLDRASRPAM